jgi:hypothetical protein
MRVPANVAFQVQVLDANARQIVPGQGPWLQVAAGEVLSCNGCHTPASAQNVPACSATAALCTTPKSHGRSGAFVSVYPGATNGVPYLDSASALPSGGPSLIPLAAETMAQTRSRATCVAGSACSEVPSLDLFYQDVWTGASFPQNPAITVTYNGVPALPTTAPCEGAGAWSPTCRTRINYPAHIQTIWDAKRTMPSGTATSCSGSCHNPAGGPAAHLDLTGTVSNNNPPWPVSYVDLLTPQTQTDANGITTVVAGPFFDAGNANGANSRTSLGIFDPTTGDTIHKGALTPAELRLISEWLDIGAQYFNNPFDPLVPVN